MPTGQVWSWPCKKSFLVLALGLGQKRIFLYAGYDVWGGKAR